jgi:hypothetical protein
MKSEKELDEDERSIASSPVRLSPADVLCGKGKESFNHGTTNFQNVQHLYFTTEQNELKFFCQIEFFVIWNLPCLHHMCAEGNHRFREIITSSVESYLASKTASERAMVVESVLENIQSSGGRFLRKHQVSGKVRF